MDVCPRFFLCCIVLSSTVFGRSNIGIAGSNPVRGMDVCPCFSVFCGPV
jgi:hypothetical protein